MYGMLGFDACPSVTIAGGAQLGRTGIARQMLAGGMALVCAKCNWDSGRTHAGPYGRRM